MVAVLTVGHGTADEAALLHRLRAASVGAVVDIRSYPGSRRHPSMERSRMASWLPAGGVAYRWEPRLGGRRRDPPGSPDTGLRVRAFAGYAAHLRTAEAAAALADLVSGARDVTTALLCAEAVWWRCHRRLVADALVLRCGAEVHHLMPDGRLVGHRLTDVVRVREDGQLVYDGAQPR